MPDEVGMEATRSDAPSADESLFGDTPDDRAAPVVQEDDSNDAALDEPDDGSEETAQDEQDSDDADEQVAGEETQPSEDLKVVVSIKDGRATIGVQQPSSDPHIESFEDLDESGLTLSGRESAEIRGRSPPWLRRLPPHSHVCGPFCV